MVHVHLNQYAGHRQRMGHIRFAASAELALMGLLGVVVSSSNAVDLVDLQIVRQIADQRVDAFRNWGLYVSTPVADVGLNFGGRRVVLLFGDGSSQFLFDHFQLNTGFFD